MMLARGPKSFYVIRFLLGAAEAGCFPGIVLYLSNWFPERQRASAMSRFMVSVPLAGMIGGPLGGALLSLSGTLGLAGWQWLYFVEGIPSIILGIAILYSFTDHPEDATWLTSAERTWLTDRLASERAARADVSEKSTLKALTSPTVWWLAILYFLTLSAYLGVIFFGPTFVAEATGMSNGRIGIVMGGVGLAGAIGTLVNSVLSDAKEERITHSIVAILIMMCGFIAGTMAHNGTMVVVGLALVSLGFNAFLPVFWCIPSTILTGTAAAGGIALINSIGNLGGFVAPNIVGVAKQTSGGYTGAFITLGTMSFVAALMTLALRRHSAIGRR
jgi:ACS family tartrate transporter-like MFS transporter